MFTSKYELTIGHNRLRLTDCKSKASLEKAASTPFSSEHILVADPDAFNVSASALFKELLTTSRWKLPKIEVFAIDGKLFKVEVMAVKKILTDVGCVDVSFADSALVADSA